MRKIRRWDGRIEGICEHGIGHTLYAPKVRQEDTGKYYEDWVHGCDGCCASMRKVDARGDDIYESDENN